MSNKKQLTKFVLSISLLLLGTLGSIYFSSYIHLFLTKGLDEFKLINLTQSIKILITEKKSRSLFLILESGTILISAFYFIIKDNFYESELIEITPDIKIPKSAGQMQFGSARFATEEEKEKMFTICDMDSKERKGDDTNIKTRKTSFSGRWHSNRVRRKIEKKSK